MDASVHCPICGSDKPHHHDDAEVRLERIERPTFEAALRDLVRHRRVARLIRTGFWLDTTPTDGFLEHTPGVISRSYARAFGWGGLEPTYADGRSHWLYRAYYGAPYYNSHIELLWLVWCAAKGASDAGE